ncbi:MAG: oligosaccharide flippase family protein [Sandarakinorhabdus sp.]|nr:oligosaccharide flippase family protein [Sandarakinorhabdus sp.]
MINAGQAALIADGRIRLASGLQVGGAIIRSVAALLAIHLLDPGLQSFLLGQLVIVAMHVLLLDAVLRRILGRPLSHSAEDGGFFGLWRRVRMLMAYGLAGALVMQIDKPLVAHFFSLELAGRWFLVVTYSLTPIALLAGPLHQYFWPRVVQAKDNPSVLLEISRHFQVATVLAVTAPCMFLAWMAPEIVSLWLGHAPDSDLVASLAAPLVLAAGFGAMGYLPTAFLIGTGRRRFAAILSWFMLLLVTAGLAVAGYAGSIHGFLLVYCLFHVVGCLVQWFWMLRHSNRRAWHPLLIGSWLLPLLLILFPYSMLMLVIAQADLGLLARLSAGIVAGAAVTAVIGWWLWAGYAKSVDAD